MDEPAHIYTPMEKDGANMSWNPSLSEPNTVVATGTTSMVPMLLEPVCEEDRFYTHRSLASITYAFFDTFGSHKPKISLMYNGQWNTLLLSYTFSDCSFSFCLTFCFVGYVLLVK